MLIKCNECTKAYSTRDVEAEHGETSWRFRYCSPECYEENKEPLSDKRHLYLYAKGWYVRTDIFEDLSVIVGKLTGMYPEHVDVGNILYWLTQEVYKQMTDYDKFFDFVSAFFPENSYLYKDPDQLEQDGIDIAIKKCISMLSLLNINDIDIELGDPDPELLPLTDFNRGDK